MDSKPVALFLRIILRCYLQKIVEALRGKLLPTRCPPNKPLHSKSEWDPFSMSVRFDVDF
eukprot:scaffold516_cov175-Amphora_coffeaeformis.AAC.17